MTPSAITRRAAAFYRSLLLLPLLLGLLPAPALAISADDQTLLTFIIRELRYFDTARRYIAQLERIYTDPQSKADLAYWRIQILQLEGNLDEASKDLAEFRKKHPNDPRGMGGDLNSVASALTKVVEALDAAGGERDPAKARAKVAEAVHAFDETVDKPLAAMIQGVEQQIVEHRKKEREKENEEKKQKGRKAGPRRQDSQLNVLLLTRDKTEITRIKMYIFYARKLPQTAPERKAVFEKGYKLAGDFVENRFDFYIMQYDAQLQKGICAYELGKHAEAAEALKILFDAEPQNRPFAPEVIDVFKEFRLQAILYGARALIETRKYEEAVKSIDKRFLKPSGDEFDLTKLSSTLEPLGVLVELEYGIALAGSGQGRKGLDVIQKLIRKYSGPGAGGNAQAYVTDARKALGRLASRGIVKLRGVDYYQAGVGLKADFRFEDAIDTFQLALASLNPRDIKEMNEVAPLCLNEIGEVNFRLERYVESALAYQQIAKYFPTLKGELMEKVPRHFLAAASKATDQLQGGLEHGGFTPVRQEAEAFRKKFGDEGFDLEQSLMVDAAKLEDEGKYAEARTKYGGVPREKGGKKVGFYHRAQISLHNTFLLEWDKADEAKKKELEPQLLKAAEAIEKIIPEALKDRDLRGAAKGALALGQIRYQRGQFAEAVEVLKLFRSELKDEEILRCFGLGYLHARRRARGRPRVRRVRLQAHHGQRLQGGAARRLCRPRALRCVRDGGRQEEGGAVHARPREAPVVEGRPREARERVVAARRLVRGGFIKEANQVINGLIKSGKAKGEELSRPDHPLQRTREGPGREVGGGHREARGISEEI